MNHFKAFEKAWTETLRPSGQVSREAVDRALVAISYFDEPQVLDDGTCEDQLPVPLLLRALRSGLDKEASAAIHTSATSQHVVETSTIFVVLQILRLFGERVDAIIDRLDDLSKTFGEGPLSQ